MQVFLFVLITKIQVFLFAFITKIQVFSMMIYTKITIIFNQIALVNKSRHRKNIFSFSFYKSCTCQ